MLRQIQFLRQHYAVTVAGLSDPLVEGVTFFPIERQQKSLLAQCTLAATLLLGYYGFAKQRFRLVAPELLAAQHFDIVLVNDLEPLPLGFALGKGAPVIFDAHEYYPKEFESSFSWRLFFQRYYVHLCKKYIPKCAAMTTVSQGLANEYEQQFGLQSTLVFSCPPGQTLPVVPHAGETIKLVHHGAANPDRGLECIIETMRLVGNRFTLDFYVVGDKQYIAQLKNSTADIDTITWQQPVATEDLCTTINRYDMGFCLLQPTTFNLANCLPNKFFECIQARLAIAVGPSPEMARIVTEHQCGVVAQDFTPQAMAQALLALTPEDIARFKHNTQSAASLFTAEQNMCTLHMVLQKALRKSGTC